MGELLAALRESGLAENTIFVFSADHGDMLGSQGLWKKQKPFDESARVPMLVRWPSALGQEARSLAAPINSEVKVSFRPNGARTASGLFLCAQIAFGSVVMSARTSVVIIANRMHPFCAITP